jgi:hypothetical protein
MAGLCIGHTCKWAHGRAEYAGKKQNNNKKKGRKFRLDEDGSATARGARRGTYTLKLSIIPIRPLAFLAIVALVGPGGHAVRIKRILGPEGSVFTQPAVYHSSNKRLGGGRTY